LEKCLKNQWEGMLTQRNHEEVWCADLKTLIHDIENGMKFLEIKDCQMDNTTLEQFNEGLS
jgi:hypothetical protein